LSAGSAVLTVINVTSVLPRPVAATEPVARQRHYLMCRPEHFEVRYAINPWMRPDEPVDRERALAQWDALRQTYVDLGHRVDLIDPVPGLPDMVYAANGATVVGGMVLGAGSPLRAIPWWSRSS
jgi:hypothetical protein